MTKSMLFLILIIALSVPCFAQSNTSETLTITTYYPAPYGVYRNLRLHPSNVPTANVDRGLMYYDNGTDELKYWAGPVKQWVNLTGGGGGVAGGWEHNSTTGHVYNVNTGNIGIGTKTPAKKLTIVGTATDPVKLQIRGPHPDFELVDTQVPSGVQISNDGNLFEILKDNAGDSDFSSTSYLMAIHIPSGNVGIGTSNPQQKLEVNGTMRLTPGATPPGAPPAGSIYYDNTKDTLRYYDAAPPAQWNNFISEYGAVNLPAGQSYVTVTFRKTYTTPPIVIPVGNQKNTLSDNTVMVFLHDVTNNNVVFDVDCVDLAYDLSKSDTCSKDIEVQYIVIPRP